MTGRVTTSHLTRKQQVLGLVAELSESLGTYHLDHVDGAFCWRFCRPEVAARIDTVRGSDGAHDFEAIMSAAADLWIEYRIPLGATCAHLERGAPLPMRSCGIKPQVNEHGVIDELKVDVFSAAWTGADIERLVTESVDSLNRNPRPSDWPVAQRTPNSASVRIGFEFTPESTAGDDYDYVRPAYLAVAVGVPLPPPGVITRAFDGMVEREGWRDGLRGAAQKQEKETALRTWAVGLLMASGSRFLDAMNAVCDKGHLDDAMQQIFTIALARRQVAPAPGQQRQPLL